MYKEGMYKAPVYIAIFMDKRVCFLEGSEFDYLEFIWSVDSVAMAIQNLMLKAVELGLGTVYIGVTNFRGIAEEVRKLAGLYENYYLVGGDSHWLSPAGTETSREASYARGDNPLHLATFLFPTPQPFLVEG